MIRIAVLSDLHPVDVSEEADSFFVIGKPKNVNTSPIDAIDDLITSENLEVDVVVCAGDIGNKGCPNKFTHGWQFINALKDKLNASSLIAVPGNHDHDSRYKYSKHDPKYNLQDMNPSFPFEDDIDNTHFWAWHFATKDFKNISFHLLNTSAFHGINEESKHGRISELTMNRLINNIDSRNESIDCEKINVVVCHHHPFTLDRIKYKDYEAMEGGSILLSEIESSSKSHWMFIHGHLHYPRIIYGHAQGTQSTLIFSAGSFSGPLDPEYHQGISNQFYILEIEDITISCPDLRGTFKSWDWAPSKGWKPATSDNGLPANGGFGFKGSINQLTNDLSSLLGEENEICGEKIYDKIPDIKYITPKDLDTVKLRLKDKKIDLEIVLGRVKNIGVMR